MKNRCCFECPIRTLGCHSTCKDYIKEVSENEEENRLRRDYNLKNGIFHMYGCPGYASEGYGKHGSKKPLKYYARGKR